MIEAEIKFCVRCATPLGRGIQFGRVRPYCPACGWIYFTDPKVAVAALVVHEDQVLLVRRINEPFRGQWSLPAGFLDAGEDPSQAVQRECQEETGLELQNVTLIDIITGREHPRGADLLLVYRAEIHGGEVRPGDDADQASLFPMDHLPPLAFKSTDDILQKYLGGRYMRGLHFSQDVD